MSLELSFLLLGLAAFFAGFVDAVVGGGGLVQVPALFSAMPQAAVPSLLATNKVSSLVGTMSAAAQYARRVRIPWKLALPGAFSAMLGSWLGALSVTLSPPDFLKPLVLVLLLGIAVYTLANKEMGTGPGRQEFGRRDLMLIMLIGMFVGFYDGFFGPGTGSLLIFLFVRFIQLDFLHASATAKIVNVATNLGALWYFSKNVEMFWMLGLMMAVANLCGAVLGSYMAVRHGAAFVRKLFIGVVSVLIVKMVLDLATQ